MFVPKETLHLLLVCLPHRTEKRKGIDPNLPLGSAGEDCRPIGLVSLATLLFLVVWHGSSVDERMEAAWIWRLVVSAIRQRVNGDQCGVASASASRRPIRNRKSRRNLLAGLDG